MRRGRALEEGGALQPLLAAAIVVGLILLSVLVGLVLGEGLSLRTLALLALPAGLLGLVFVTRYSQSLILLLPLTALFLPYVQMPTGTESPVPLSLLLACGLSGLWIATVLLRGGRLSPSLLNAPILIFCAICIVSLFWGLAWRDPWLIRAPKFIVTQVGALVTILMSPTAALLVGNFVTSERQLKFIFGAFIVGGVLMTATQLLHIEQKLLNDRGLWAMWTVVPLFALLIAQPGVRWYWRLLIAGALLLTLYQTMIVNRDWLSGWVPSIVALAALVYIRSPKTFFALLPFGVLAIVVSYGFFRMVAQENIDDGSLERLIIWEQNWRVVKDHWFLGTGPAGYAIYYMTYFPAEARSTHNNYLDIVAQFGFVGLGVWFWLAFAGFWEGWRLSRSLPEGFTRTLAMAATAGWIGACASMFFGDWILPFAYNQGIAGYKYTVYTWIFLGTLIVVRRLATARQQAEVYA
jgi:O-antigen ligase